MTTPPIVWIEGIRYRCVADLGAQAGGIEARVVVPLFSKAADPPRLLIAREDRRQPWRLWTEFDRDRGILPAVGGGGFRQIDGRDCLRTRAARKVPNHRG